MSFSRPLETIVFLLSARTRGDVAAALSCYEPGATVVMRPGEVGSGEDAVKGFIEAAMTLPITYGDRKIVEAGDVALHLSEWMLRSEGGAEITGRTTDVLRRQPDGKWLLAIDNPWGAALLDERAAS